MSNIAFLRNVASSTKLKEGSIAELMKRVEKLDPGMSDADKAKLDSALADAFVSVSAHLDLIEAGSGKMLPNQRAGAASNFKLPKAED